MRKIVFTAMALLMASACCFSAETKETVVGKWLLPSPTLLEFHDDFVVDINPMLADLLGDVQGKYRMENGEVIIEAGAVTTHIVFVNDSLLELSAENGEKILLLKGPEGPANDAYYSQPFLAAMNENIQSASEGAKFATCLSTLHSVQQAEEMRNLDYGAYTINPDQLDTYLATDCLESEGCGGVTKNSVEKYCDNFELSWGGEGNYSYFITATVKDAGACGICLSPSGYAPQSIEECADGKTAKERCAELSGD